MLPSNTVSAEKVLRRCKLIAVVGASKNPEKEAHRVPLYLKEHGYQIIPVNPTAESIIGERSYPSLLHMPEALMKKIDVIDVFRPSEELPEIAKQAVKMGKKANKKYVFWAQLGLENEDAKQILAKENFPYIMNKCMMAEHKMLNAEEKS